MRVTKLSVHNILGIQDLSLEGLGKITLIEGANATGKSSLLEAVKFALKGGHDATLLRAGAERGEVVLVLDDGTTVEHAVTADSSPPPKVTDPTRGRISKPVAFLDRLRDLTSLNPVSFLLAPERDQARILLETVPLELDREAVRTAAGIPLAEGELAGEPLEVLDRVRRKVYDQRTGANRVAGDKRSTAAELQRTLPPGDQPAADLDGLYAQERKLAERLQLLHGQHAEKLATEKDRLRGQENQELEQVRTKYRRQVEATQTELDRYHEEARAPLLARQRELSRDIGVAVEAKEQVARAQYARELLERTVNEAEAAEGESSVLTAALENLDDIRAGLLANLPVKGLEIVDGVIHLDGVPFSRVNTARRVAFALRIAALRAGELGIVCVDDLEHLDAQTFNAFLKAAAKSKLQFFVTRVTEGPLRIRTGDQVPAFAEPDPSPAAA